MDKKHTFIVWIIVVLLVYNIFVSSNIRTDVKYYENKISNIQTKIDSVNKLNKALDIKLDSLNTQLKVLDSSIVNVQFNIETIKQNTDEKINSVDNFTFTELEHFFSDRYKTRLNSTSQGTNR